MNEKIRSIKAARALIIDVGGLNSEGDPNNGPPSLIFRVSLNYVIHIICHPQNSEFNKLKISGQ